jgi:hypothetical protein
MENTIRRMAAFSRWMPLPPAPSVRDWLVPVTLAIATGGALLVLSIRHPLFRGAVGGIAALLVGACLLSAYHHRRLREELAATTGGDIGAFARSFNRRAAGFDAWVVRATWDAVQQLLTAGVGTRSLRAQDALAALDIEDDELAFDLLPTIAKRTGRAWPPVPPPSGRFPALVTVADVVSFVTALPKREA